MALNELERISSSPGLLFLLDEPEAALHRSAEAQMAAYFERLADTAAQHVIAATHSPELLDTATARVFEIRRHEGRRIVKQLDAVSRDNMAELGLQPSDLLRRQRGFILVEGAHDSLFIEELFGPQMRRLRIETLALRGTSDLSSAKIRFLFDNTPAHVFVLLDNIRAYELSRTWTSVLEHQRRGRLDEAHNVLDSVECLRATKEGKKLKRLLAEALLNGYADRLTPHGLNKADIIEYLPVEAFVAGATDWSALRVEHRQRRNDKPNTPKDFKKWLAGEPHRADFRSDAMRAIIQQLDAVPPDLLRLLKTVEAHSTKGTWPATCDSSRSFPRRNCGTNMNVASQRKTCGREKERGVGANRVESPPSGRGPRCPGGRGQPGELTATTACSLSGSTTIRWLEGVNVRLGRGGRTARRG